MLNLGLNRVMSLLAALVLTAVSVQSAQASWEVPAAASSFLQIPRLTRVNANLYRGGQPETAEDYEILRKNGVRTIINLRTSREFIEQDRAAAARLQMGFRSYPIHGWEYPKKEFVNQILRDMTDPRLAPVFVHCQHGKDRTGLVNGLYRVYVDHWSPERAYDEMLSFGFVKWLPLNKFYWDYIEAHPPGRRR